MSILLRWLATATAIILSAYLISGVSVDSFVTALWLAVVLGLINAVLRPILVILTLPINILTLGLFVFVINAGLVMLASNFTKGFEVSGFWAALLFSVTLSIISYLLNVLIKK